MLYQFLAVVVQGLWCEVVSETVFFCADRLFRRFVCWRAFYVEVKSYLEFLLRGGSVRLEPRLFGGPDLM